MKPRDAQKDFISDFETHADGNQNASCIFKSDHHHVCSRGLIGDLGETRPTEKKKRPNGVWNRSCVSCSVRPLDKGQCMGAKHSGISRFPSLGCVEISGGLYKMRVQRRWVCAAKRWENSGGGTGWMSDLCARSVHSTARSFQGSDLERWAALSNATMTKVPTRWSRCVLRVTE